MGKYIFTKYITIECRKTIITSFDPVKAARRILTPPRSPLLGLGYISRGIEEGEDAIGRLVMVVIPQLLTGSVLTINFVVGCGSKPDPDDSDRGRLKGSRSMPDVEFGILWGPGVLGVEEDLPLEGLEFALLCFLYLTWKQEKKGGCIIVWSGSGSRAKRHTVPHSFSNRGLCVV